MIPLNHTMYAHSCEQLLAELPWAALCVDDVGVVQGANRAASKLLAVPAPDLLAQPLAHFLSPSSIPTFYDALRSAETTATNNALIELTLHQQVLLLNCAVRSFGTLSNTARFLITMQQQVDPEHLSASLSVAAAQCFEAQTVSVFTDVLQQALTPFGLVVNVVLYDRDQHDWTSISSGWAAAKPEQRSHVASDVWTSLLAQRRDLQEPCCMTLAEVVGAEPDVVAEPSLLLLKLLGQESCVVVPLRSDRETNGALLISGSSLCHELIALFMPFVHVLGAALNKINQLPDGQLNQLQTALLLKANQAITAVTELDDVLRVICQQALILSGASTASLFMPESDAQYLRCVMALGEHSDILLGHRSELLNTPVGRVFLEQQNLIVDDHRLLYGNDTTFRDAPFLNGLFVTLQTQGRSAGVLALWNDTPSSFGQVELQILERYGANAMVAIENAQLHEAMRRSEERYRTLFQNALEIVITLDLEGWITSWNRAALQFLGMSPAELRGNSLNISDLLLPETADLMAHLQSNALAGLEPTLTELELRRPGGAIAVVELTVQVFQERGQVTGVYIIGRDVTERRQQRRMLTDKIAQLTALHQLSVALSSSFERNGILQRAIEAIALANQFDCVSVYSINQQRERLELTASTGLDQQTIEFIRYALPGSKIWGVFHNQVTLVSTSADLQPPLKLLFERKNVLGHAFLPLVAASGAQGVLAIGRSGHGVFSENELRVLQTMASQIGQALEKIQLYATIEHSAARYRDLYENANDFIGTMTMDGRFTSLNRAALQFLGYDEADVSYLALSDLMLQNNSRQPNDVLKMLQSREAARGVSELQVIRKNGSLAMLEIRSRVVFENDVPTAIHFIARDITERRQLEAQVRQGEKLAALGQLVAGAAHELNNPLAVVLGTTQLLLRDPLAMAFNEDVRNIEAAAQRAKHIVKQMLTFAREQEDVRAPVEVPQLINRVLQGMRLNFQRNAVQVSVTMAPDLPPIWGDAYQLEQVLDNLLHNAVQAISDGPRPSRCVGVEAHMLGSMVQLRVSDTGPGILPHVLPRIFDPFFTTKEVGSGTGLGLSLVFGIVDKHGGSIRCESVHGQGATFIVELPAATVAATEASILISSPTNSTILIVEDEYDVRLILERALSQYGYGVDAVPSGEAALAKIAEKQYDLIITDMRMPGMSGKDLFERVRVTKPQLSWVFITGDTMSASSEAFLKQIGVPFLPKPFTLEELWDAVASSILRDREPLKVA